jgi:hypothetical protein
MASAAEAAVAKTAIESAAGKGLGASPQTSLLLPPKG